MKTENQIVKQALELSSEETKEKILEVARKFPTRMTSWHKFHGNVLPPIGITKEGEALWMNREMRRRKMKRTK